MRPLFFLFLLILIPFAGQCGSISGKISDQKGETLPFATVFVVGTTVGTSANAAGEYMLQLAPGTYKIACQFIGYKQQVYTAVISDAPLVHNFSLEEQSLEMKAVEVKASEDPALYIMRKVIAKRSFHANQIKTFQTGIYLKGVFKTRQTPNKVLGQKVEAGEMGLDSAGKGILYLCEQVATYYTQGNRDQTIIHSVRESGDPNGLGLSRFPPVINMYENNVKVASGFSPRGFISPVSDAALGYYKFKLEGDFTESGNTIYKIRVTPKRKYEPLFTGVIYIVDDQYALHSVDLLTTKTSNLEFLDSLRVEQIYLPLDKETWIIKQQVMHAAVKLFGFDIVGNFVTVYNDQKVNQQIPDSVFDKKISSIYDKGANKKDTSYWTTNRPIPLQQEETKDYLVKDSLRIRFDDPLYKDSMRRRSNRPSPGNLFFSGYSYAGKENKFRIRTNALATGLLNYNTIEGLNLAPRLFINYNLDSFQSIIAAVGYRYGFGNKHSNAIGRFSYWKDARNWIGRYWYTGFEAGSYVYQFNPSNPVDPLFNTVSTLFYRKNYLKLYERMNASVFFGRNLGNGFKYHGEIGWQKRIPLYNSTDFSFVSESTGGFSENLPEVPGVTSWGEHEAVIAKLRVSYQPGITYTQYPDYKMPHGSSWPVFTLGYEKGIPDVLESKTDFDRVKLGIRDNVNMKLFGGLNYNVKFGGLINSNALAVQDMNHISGNQMLLASTYLESFQFAPYYQYTNTDKGFAETHVEWHLRGFLTNKIPLLRQLRWYLVAGANHYMTTGDINYLETFVGIDNLGYDKFRMFRLDFIQSWDSFKQNTVGFRLGFSPGSIIRINMGDAGTEW